MLLGETTYKLTVPTAEDFSESPDDADDPDTLPKQWDAFQDAGVGKP